MTLSPNFELREFNATRKPLHEAETLPPWCYTSPEFYEAERKNIFMKCWNFIGRADLLQNPGDYFTIEFVGVPLIIVRGRDDVVRAFANTCRHRGARLVEGEGNCRAFKCPYHSWVYGLDGSLKGFAGMESAEDFDPAEYGLIEIRLETWGGFIFINFDQKAEGLIDYLGDFVTTFDTFNCENLITTRRNVYDLKCNWKIYIENAMEEYHVPHVHRGSISKLQVGHQPIPTVGNWDAIREEHDGTRALLEEDQDRAFPVIPTLSPHLAAGSHFVCLYPSTMLGVTKDCLWWLEEHPKGPDEMTLVVGTCFPKETIARSDFDERVQYYYKRWDKSINEDNQISEIQHLGLRSPLARPGRYSHLEPLVHRIANWTVDRIFDEETRGTSKAALTGND